MKFKINLNKIIPLKRDSDFFLYNSCKRCSISTTSVNLNYRRFVFRTFRQFAYGKQQQIETKSHSLYSFYLVPFEFRTTFESFVYLSSSCPWIAFAAYCHSLFDSLELLNTLNRLLNLVVSLCRKVLPVCGESPTLPPATAYVVLLRDLV